ncbi:uncharacterized protein LOC136075259 [Hydra vulgaris]|uniref:Uncharacterized protein LOC136075259 n=1 Tax=Hydra vulgaris TaxID=6087 RepID=A0ABM4B507_HYDVU
MDDEVVGKEIDFKENKVVLTSDDNDDEVPEVIVIEDDPVFELDLNLYNSDTEEIDFVIKNNSIKETTITETIKENNPNELPLEFTEDLLPQEITHCSPTQLNSTNDPTPTQPQENNILKKKKCGYISIYYSKSNM